MLIPFHSPGGGITNSPNYQALGTPTSSGGTVTPGWPAHQAGDIGLLIVETANQTATLSNDQGFVEISGSAQGVGTPGNAAAAGVTVFWCRATSGSMSAPTVADSGHHQGAAIITFRGCVSTGNPWNAISGDTEAGSSDVTFPAVSALYEKSLIVNILATSAAGSASASFDGWTNAGLVSIDERIDYGAGGAGNIGCATGVKTSSGSSGSTTATIIGTEAQARVTLALTGI